MVEGIWKGDIRVFLLVFVKASYTLNLQVTLLASDPPISTQSNLLLSEQNYDKLSSSWNCCRTQQNFHPLLFNFPTCQCHSRKEIINTQAWMPTLHSPRKIIVQEKEIWLSSVSLSGCRALLHLKPLNHWFCFCFFLLFLLAEPVKRQVRTVKSGSHLC